MELSAGLAADLARLTDALDDSATDLADLVGSVHDAFVVAVPSALGVAFTIRASPAEVTVSTLDGAAMAVATSRLAELSVIQQALGVLIDRGRTPQAGVYELEHLARESDTTVHAAAARLIRDCPTADPPGG